MPVLIRMPEISAGTESAAIAGWMVSVGDTLAPGDVITDIETDKATIEYAVEEGGTVAGFLAEIGDTVAVGTPIAVLAGDGESAADALAAAGSGSNADSGSSVADTAVPAAATAPAEPATLGAPAAPAGAEAPAASCATGTSCSTGDVSRGETVASPADPADHIRRFASPIARRLARERGLDIAAITGTGPGGRIVRRDVESASVSASASAAPVSTGTAASASAPAPAPAREGVTRIPHTGMRRAIARRLTESKTTVPHYYLKADVRVDALLELRKQVNAANSETKISVNDFIMKAVAGALVEVPEANAIWTDDAIERFDSVDIAVAVSIDAGLLTPVVRGVEQLSISALSATIRDLVARARDGKLRQHELEGGSFSVSNLGMYGIEEFAAIINPPHSGILAVGTASARPVVTDSGIESATVMTVTLSADHRVMDGALAATWIAAFKRRIENPLILLV
jgi:pyruvate dehydrogenase E2 component (dihydrolipoamide acetyltransferase)